MKPFTKHAGRMVTLDRANIDTDQIIPKQFLKRIERSGFGQYLFYDWRFLPDGSINSDFELNRPENLGATILVTRRNFGSGSSREHAVWALDDYGFRSVIAPSFADIFYNNCFKNGLLPIQLPESQVEQLFQLHQANPQEQIRINLETCHLTGPNGIDWTFEVEPFRRHCLIHGLDDIGLTLQHENAITNYERAKGMDIALVR